MFSVGSPALITLILMFSLYLVAIKIPKPHRSSNEPLGELRKGFEELKD